VPFAALLDACVLYPVTLRDTLLRLAEVGFYVPLWSDDILEETRRSILRDRPDLTSTSLDRMFSALARAFPASRVEGYQGLVASMTNDPADRHVLAAAVTGGAGVIVTHNVRHFAEVALAPWAIEVQQPDEFLGDLLDLDPQLVVEVLRVQAAERERPPTSLEEMLGFLAKQVPAFVAEVRRLLDYQ
jgi:predicted nucleic acid-binding protein